MLIMEFVIEEREREKKSLCSSKDRIKHKTIKCPIKGMAKSSSMFICFSKQDFIPSVELSSIVYLILLQG